MNNAEYWARRYKIMEDALKDQSLDYVENLEKQFDAAIRSIDTQMRAWYQRFAVNNNITFAEARRILTTDELKEFRWTVQEYIEKGKEMGLTGAWMKELENASARVHISRLDALKYQLRQQAEVLTQARIKATTDASALAYTESYYHTAFELQRGLGVGWTMQALNDEAVKKVLSRPWTTDGQTFTARCWNDKAKLVESVNRELTRMVVTGEAPDRAIAAIAKQFNTSKSNAGRVVMTESAYFSGAAQKDCFNELDVEEYKVVGTLDSATCETCGDMDGKVFKMTEYEIGSTAPPFHPWCRCCTAPYFEDMEGVGERYARDAVTGERYTLPKDTTYAEWKKLQDEKYGAGTVDLQHTMAYNETADREQYERYKSVLRERCPESFEGFQRIKHSDPEIWGRFKHEYRIINRYEVEGEVSAETILKLDEAAYTTKRKGFDKDRFSGQDRTAVKAMSRSGNIAAMEYDDKIFIAHSQADYPGTPRYDSFVLKDKYTLVGMTRPRQFKVKDLGDKIPREYDTEAKMLEFVAAGITDSETVSEITILSEKHICESCAGVVEQFRKKFPNITVNIVSGKRGYNGSEGGTWTWKYRKD